MNYDRLIDELTNDLRPVEPLQPEWRRLMNWLAMSLPAAALVVLMMGLRPDVAEKLAERMFIAQELAMIAVAVVGAWVAFLAVVPGSPRSALWAPVIPLAAWIATMGAQYWSDLSVSGFAGMAFAVDLKCVPGIAMSGLVPIIAMIVMLRKGARFKRGVAVFWGTLASAALANAGLRLFHTIDAALMVIVWQFGTVLLFTALATMAKDILLPIKPVVLANA